MTGKAPEADTFCAPVKSPAEGIPMSKLETCPVDPRVAVNS